MESEAAGVCGTVKRDFFGRREKDAARADRTTKT